MAMIQPGADRPERDPVEYQFPTGMYAMRLDRVQEIGPSPKFPDGNNRLVFEFVHPDGPYRGKKACMFLGKTVYKNPRTGKESALVKHARSMGVVRPEQGFDPDSLVGKMYTVMCELEDDRAWVRSAIPHNPTQAAPPPGQPAAPPPPELPFDRAAAAPPPSPPRQQPPAPPAPPPSPAAVMWYVCWPNTNKSDGPFTQEHIEARGRDDGHSPADVQVCRAGEQQWQPADRAGFKFDLPF